MHYKLKIDIVTCTDFYVGAIIFKLWVTILQLFAKKQNIYENDKMFINFTLKER